MLPRPQKIAGQRDELLVCRCYFHEGSRCIPVVPLHYKLAVLTHASGVTSKATPFLSLTCPSPRALTSRSAIVLYVRHPT